MIFYCDRCGRCFMGLSYEIGKECDICKNKTKIVPDKYFEDPGFKGKLSDEMKQKLYQELVIPSPNFDQYWFDNRDRCVEEINQKWESNEAAMAHGKAVAEGKDKGNSYGISCPYCKATNVKKISMTSRVVSTGLFGFGSKKIGKQWHCTHCGSDF